MVTKEVIRIFSYLVAPGKNEPEPDEVKGTTVPLTGRLSEMLTGVFTRADQECDIPICFRMAGDGTQKNPVRDDLIALIKEPKLSTGQRLATRLRDHTTSKSGLGLLFFISGKSKAGHKLVIPRFPADHGILAEIHGRSLEVQFIEKVFMKKAATYKAAIYRGSSLDAHFWDGAAVDKQMTSSADEVANYWIHGFLDSELKTTPKAGSRRLARALKAALNTAPTPRVRQEIVAAASLVPGLAGQSLSIDEIFHRFGFSDAARQVIAQQVSSPSLLADRFILDATEFQTQVGIRTEELHTGVSVSAPADVFEQHVRRSVINEDRNEYRYMTEGQIVAQKLKGHS